MNNPNQYPASGFWRRPKTIKDGAFGRINFQKIADANASELNAFLSQKTIQDPDQADQLLSIYESFNEGNAAPRFEDSMGAVNGIDVYKVTYRTRSPDTGKRYRVSGLLSVPVSAKQAPIRTSPPLASYQHGTILYPQDAPSNLFKKDAINLDPYGAPYSAETLFNLVKLGGNGFVVAASDYIGNDNSKNTQAYDVKETTIQTTNDMIKASRAVLNSLGIASEEVFLTGWSKGGLNTQWLADALQTKGDPAERIAVASGPSDLYANLKYWVNGYPDTPPWLSAAIPLVFGAYQKYYNMDGLMRKAIQPQYLETAKQIYNKTFDWSKGFPDLPADPKQMLTDKIIGQVNSGTGIFVEKFISNTALQAEYSTPAVFFGGDKDTLFHRVTPSRFPSITKKTLAALLQAARTWKRQRRTAAHSYQASLIQIKAIFSIHSPHLIFSSTST